MVKSRQKSRAFLKWAGGKYNLVDAIQQHLPDSDTLIEPFVGAGSVFLNTDYPSYKLNDINADLINLYQLVKTQPDSFIADAKTLFTQLTNQREVYLRLRQQFNLSDDAYERALLFLYLNRHGYNGLCRYNLSGKFNVPFGSYKKPYFPQAELYFFAEKAQRAEFSCASYQQLMLQAPVGAVVYCLYRTKKELFAWVVDNALIFESFLRKVLFTFTRKRRFVNHAYKWRTY